MKHITIILLTFLSFSCQSQDTLIYYTQDYVDSVNAVCDTQVANLQQFISEILDERQNPVILGDTEVTIYDTSGIVIMLKKQGLNLEYQIIKDSLRHSFFIEDNELKLVIGKGNKSNVVIRYDFDNYELKEYAKNGIQ